uniref:SEC7 domain-containing protein n=1 Tax=Trypanosoma congolense (strain IL3000) TaxID=1068625 RepID=G0URE6_TRYCI|nr:conserved hypothetical protein [Trypanosoma congolense IL3000]
MQFKGQNSADLENRRTFMVQLHAFLLQARHIVSGTPKGKLRDILGSIDEWIKEVSTAEVATPSTTASTHTSVTEVTADETSKTLQPGAVGADETAAAPEATSSESSRLPSKPQVEDCSPPTAAAAGSAEVDGVDRQKGPETIANYSSDLSERNVEDLARFIASLFVGAASEDVKLRNVGRNAARITITRCFSILDNVLLQVVDELYNSQTQEVDVGARDIATERRSERAALFVSFAHDITSCVNAIGSCVNTLTKPSDFQSVRFATQVCIDVLKQLRHTAVHFERRFMSQELRHTREVIGGTAAHCDNVAHDTRGEARHSAERRAEDLKQRLGPAFLGSITHLMGLLRPVVGFLINVVSIKPSATSEEEKTTKNDAVTNLFGFARWQWRASHLKRHGDPPLDSQSEASRSTEVVDGTDVSQQSYRVVCRVVESVLLTSFSPEFMACMAQHCGDNSEGRILAVRLLRDMVSELVDKDVTEMEYVLRHARWRKRVADGILNCVVSVRASVLDVGLEILQRIVVSCPHHLGTEVGFLYSNGIFGLLESDSTPPFVRRALLHHIIDTFFIKSNLPGESPLFQCYRRFDLNIHWHQLNIIQQTVVSLAKVVRCAAPDEFDDVEGPKPRKSVTLSGGGVTGSSNERGGEGGSQNNTQTADGVSKGQPANAGGLDDGTITMQRSLPFLALHGLSTMVELLAKQIPHNTGLSNWKPLPRLLNRKRKMEQERIIEAINSSPVKGIRRLFNIKDDEWQTESDSVIAENNWSHRHIPYPSTPEAEERVRRIAQFLKETPSLSSEAVSDFLSYPAVIPLQVCRAFMDSLPLAGKSLLQGFQELFSTVKLPKEGQRIERLIEFFCSSYYKAGTEGAVDTDNFPFVSEDACFIAGIGIIMLNTNLHNPNASSVKMTADSFYSQMRECNNNKGFSRRFTDGIFEEISTRSLSNLLDATAVNAKRCDSMAPHGRMDSLFFTSDDRKEMAFNVARQRIADETRELVFRCSRLEAGDDGLDLAEGESAQEYWTSVTQDLFLSTWPSLSAVFGAEVEGHQLPNDALLLYVSGLRSSLFLSAAFGLHTECDTSQSALMHLSTFESVRDVCHSCLLEVASSHHSVHFSSRCWVPVVELLVSIRKEQNQTQPHQMQSQQRRAILVQMESLFAHLEEITREYCNMNVHEAPPVIVVAVRELLQGVSMLLRDTSGDCPSLTAALYVVRRLLSYSVISHDQEMGAVVTNLINARDLSGFIIPALVDVVEAWCDKGDEGLQAITGFAVDVLSVVWNSCVRDANSTQQVVSITELTDCFSFFQLCRERCANSPVAQMHMLQGVKELVACTAFAESSIKSRASRGVSSRTLFDMALVWERLLHSVAHAVSSKSTVDTEMCSLAVHILQKLICISCGTGSSLPSARMRQEPLKVLLSILSNVAYVGGMCSGMESAQSCLSQLSFLCTSALSHEPVPLSEGVEVTSDGGDLEVSGANTTQARLTRCLIQNMQAREDFVVLHVVERMCMMLCCQAQETRAEVISALRVLCRQLKGRDQRQHLVVHMADTILEASLDRTTLESNSSVAAVGPAAEVSSWATSFALLNLPTPPTMRKCSAAAFRTTLPQLLNFISHDLLADASVEELASLAVIVMERCLLPLAVSRHSSSHMRPLAVRSIMQCAALCVSAVSRLSEPLTETEKEAVGACLSSITGSVGLVLLSAYIPRELIVPHNTQYVGNQWGTSASPELAAYVEAGWGTIEFFSTKEPHDITGSCLCATMRIVGERSEGSSYESRGVAAGDPAEDKPGMTADGEADSSTHAEVAVVSDERLIEYCNLMVQLLPALPKVLDVIVPLLHMGISERQGGQARDQGWWSLPSCNYKVLGDLLLNASSIFFAAYWRVNHTAEMEHFVTQSVTKGRVAAPINKGSALLPHSAVRGALNAYFSLALLMDSARLREVLVEVLRGTALAQSLSSSARRPRYAGDTLPDGTASPQLSPRGQQFVRACNVGMYQELSAVVIHWTKNLMSQVQPDTSTLAGEQQKGLAMVMREPIVFKGLVELLTAAGGDIVTTVHDYLAWYIADHQPQ